MGCDIHAHIEVKIEDKWEHYSCPPLRRWYNLFERIAGVRGTLANAIAPPRGVPQDMNIDTKVCYEFEKKNGIHTSTWLTKQEFNTIIKEIDKINLLDIKYIHYNWQHNELGYLTGNGFNLFPGSNPPEIEDVRFICWFDN